MTAAADTSTKKFADYTCKRPAGIFPRAFFLRIADYSLSPMPFAINAAKSMISTTPTIS